MNLTTQPTLTFVPPVATGAQIQSDLSTVPNDGTSKATITVYLQNGLGRPAAGKTVSLAQGGGNAVITPAGSSQPGSTAVTDGSGYATFLATDTNAESVNFTAEDVTDNNLPVPGERDGQLRPEHGDMRDGIAQAGQRLHGLGLRHRLCLQHRGHRLSGQLHGAGVHRPRVRAGRRRGRATCTSPMGRTARSTCSGPGGGQAEPANQLPDAKFPGGSLGAAGVRQGRIAVCRPDPVQRQRPQTRRSCSSTPRPGRRSGSWPATATGLPDCPFVLAIDPLSGDLFTDDECNGFAASNQISRIHDPGGAEPDGVELSDDRRMQPRDVVRARWHAVPGQLQRRGRLDRWDQYQQSVRHQGGQRRGRAFGGGDRCQRCGQGDKLDGVLDRRRGHGRGPDADSRRGHHRGHRHVAVLHHRRRPPTAVRTARFRGRS